MSKAEQTSITIEEEVSEEDRIKERQSSVGRICTKRKLVEKQSNQLWEIYGRLTELLLSRKWGKNLFIFTFSTVAEKQKRVVGKPWLFDNTL